MALFSRILRLLSELRSERACPGARRGAGRSGVHESAGRADSDALEEEMCPPPRRSRRSPAGAMSADVVGIVSSEEYLRRNLRILLVRRP